MESSKRCVKLVSLIFIIKFQLVNKSRVFLKKNQKVITKKPINQHFLVFLPQVEKEWTSSSILPNNRLLGMCRWMGSHFHNWTDYNGVTFFSRVTGMGRTFLGFLG